MPISSMGVRNSGMLEFRNFRVMFKKQSKQLATKKQHQSRCAMITHWIMKHNLIFMISFRNIWKCEHSGIQVRIPKLKCQISDCNITECWNSSKSEFRTLGFTNNREFWNSLQKSEHLATFVVNILIWVY